MTTKPNLIEMPWLPCRMSSGDNIEFLNLRQVFERCGDIEDIFSSSVTESAALRRFLLAVFVRIYRTEVPEWKESLRRAGILPIQPFDDYVAELGHRFDLFHPERPFYQHPQPSSEKKHSLNSLVFEDANGVNAVWFSHRHEEDGRVMTNAEAARALISMQAYAVGGGVSKPFYLSHGTLIAGGIVFWIAGRNLLESLLLNVPSQYFGMNDPKDMPAWERPLIAPRQRAADGLLDLLTFQSRCLRLTRRDDDTVDGVFISQGDKNLSPHRDPMMAYYMTDKDEERVLGLNRNKALWREYQVLYAATTGSPRYRPPQILADQFSLYDGPMHIDVHAFGVQTYQGKIEHSHMERFPYYPGIVDTNDLDKRDRVDDFLHIASAVRKSLDRGLQRFAKVLLYPDKASLGDLEYKDVRALKASFSWEARYWASLGTMIHDYIKRLAESRSADERTTIVETWRSECGRTAEHVLRSITDSYGTTARSARAAALSHTDLRRELATAAADA